MNGVLAKAIAKAAASLFEEEGIAVVPLDPTLPPPKSLQPEGDILSVDRRGIEKCVKHMLWDRRNTPTVQSGRGAIAVGRKEDDSVVVALCSMETSNDV